MVRLVTILTAFLIVPSLHAQTKSPFNAALLKTNLERVRESFRVPGMAVVALQDGKVVFREGFGLRSIEEKKPFTSDTICLVASTTKSMTAGLVGTLVDDGTLEWTRPVREYWPEFKMLDAFASSEMTLEDMLCHRSGLPYHENLLAHGVGRELPDKTQARQYRLDLLKRLVYFEPSHSFRSHWQYQDVIYASAGGIVEQATGKHYEDLIQKRILDPLGMKESTFSRRQARATGRLAQGYGTVDGAVVPIPFNDTRYLAPTAGLYSSADEMAKWVQLQIDKGKLGNRQIISEASMDWVHAAHVVSANDGVSLGGGLVTYGQGWMQHLFRGLPTLGHSGSFNGYRTHISFIPEKKIGVVVLTNLNLSQAMVAASFVTLDGLLGHASAEQWIEYFQALEKMAAEAEETAKRAFASGRDLSKTPRHDMQAYTGSFYHPGYGTFEVAIRDGALQQTYDGRSFDVKPYNGETFETRYQSTENHLHHMTMAFETDDDGKVIAVRIPIVPGIAPPRFVRK
jgi:CubicO group peptidase (beta-lactamase class C family)